MQNCIFSGHCIQPKCDQSCPILAETKYLLDRNKLNMQSDVFHCNVDRLAWYDSLMDEHAGKLITLVDSDTVKVADNVTYAAICKYWKGSQLHCTVYNLRYSTYIDSVQNSWSMKSDNNDLEMMKIWATTAKVLIISNIDYVNFKDFQCQTLLSLIQSRTADKLTTIVVSPNPSSLVGSSMFFPKLQSMLQTSKVVKK